jgi:hypothetical protein
MPSGQPSVRPALAEADGAALALGATLAGAALADDGGEALEDGAGSPDPARAHDAQSAGTNANTAQRRKGEDMTNRVRPLPGSRSFVMDEHPGDRGRWVAWGLVT